MAVYNEKDKSKWTKDGRHWYFRISYRDTKGKKRYHYSKMYASREEAEAEELAFKTKKNNPIMVKFNVVASEYFKYMYTSRKESSVYSYENAYNKNIKPYFESFNISSIEIRHINYWKLELLKKNFKLSYLNKIYNILKSIFDFAMRNYDLDRNVVAISGRFERVRNEVIPDKKKLRYITFEEFKTLISAIDDITWKTFFIFLYYTGMRKGEVQALTWNDIDFEENEIIVNKTLYSKIKGKYIITSTKTNCNRIIKMSDVLKEQLVYYKKYVQQYSDFKESWFVFGCTRFLPPTTIDNKKHLYFKKSGLKREITIHEFRHSHVSLLVNEYIKKCKELNIKIDTYKFFLMLANRMGHGVKVMMETYMHLFPTIQDEIVDLLNNL